MTLGQAIDEYSDMGMSQYSGVTFKEVLSRTNRLELVNLCLNSFSQQNIEDNGKPKGRGKPKSATTKLAEKLDVSPRTTARWANQGWQSNNVNAEALADLAYELNPDKTINILRKAIETYRIIIDEWIADKNNEDLDSRWSQRLLSSSPDANPAHTEGGNNG